MNRTNQLPICLWILFVFFSSFCCASLEAREVREDSLAVKGFHLDLRIQPMRMEALKALALKLSKQGINTLLMEWEANYPYQQHRVISSQNAYSREEIKSFIAYCNTLHMDVIPLQQSFGHVEYILKHYRYKELREDQKDYSQVNPLKEEQCKALFTDLYKDLISTHTSRYIHIGGDETYLLGHSKESQEKVAAVGKGRLYGDYLKLLCDIVVSLGKIPIVWADIALHYPDALSSLPKETIFMDWNYGWDFDHFGDHRKLMESGFEIWGAPAIRSSPDNYFLVDWQKHFNNIRTFIPRARALGYRGMIMTSWSTSGIYSPMFESDTEVIDLHAIRRVYPISGFNMLIGAYTQSLQTKDPLNINAFVTHYAEEQYGLNEEEALSFWNALKLAPYEVSQGKVRGKDLSIKALRDSAAFTAVALRKIQATRNKKAFAHYRLLADIRLFYLTCMYVEEQMNLPTYTPDQARALLQLLDKTDPDQLNQRFKDLNGYLLYPNEIALENALRNKRLETLKALLTHQIGE